jgi:hypothetical protein
MLLVSKVSHCSAQSRCEIRTSDDEEGREGTDAFERGHSDRWRHLRESMVLVEGCENLQEGRWSNQESNVGNRNLIDSSRMSPKATPMVPFLRF